jgi:hypothetical protein
METPCAASYLYLKLAKPPYFSFLKKKTKVEMLAALINLCEVVGLFFQVSIYFEDFEKNQLVHSTALGNMLL